MNKILARHASDKSELIKRFQARLSIVSLPLSVFLFFSFISSLLDASLRLRLRVPPLSFLLSLSSFFYFYTFRFRGNLNAGAIR